MTALAHRRHAIAALLLACSLWGLSVPLSKLALDWLSPSWLAAGRFLLAGAALALLGRRGLRGALHWRVIATGVCGFGLSIELQNLGLARTSVSQAALLIGATPALVAVIGLGLGHGRVSAREWLSYGAAVLGIFLVAGGAGGNASLSGDLLVLGSVVLMSTSIACQPVVLAGRDPAAVTSVQCFSGGLAALFFCGGHGVAAPGSAAPVLAFVGLAFLATLLPFWLFALAQTRVPARLAGAFVPLEPVVGAVIGWLGFGDPFTPLGLVGSLLVVAGIGLAAVPGPAPVPALARGRLWRPRLTREPLRQIIHIERFGA